MMRTNHQSRHFWFLVLAQACAVASVLVWGILRHPGLPPGLRAVATRADLFGGLKTALDMFSNDCGRYPTTAEGFQVLMARPTNNTPQGWRGPYFDPLPKDPWGHDYIYRYPGIHNTNGFDLYSTGPDGISKSGGSDPDDINNWDITSPRGGDFSEADPFPLVVSLLLFIPLACGVCSIGMISSPEGRGFYARNRNAHFVWLLISMIAFIMVLSLVPQIAHR